MAGYWMKLMLGGGLLFSLLVALGHGDQTVQTSSAKETVSPGFVLPQKHDTRLTPTEQNGQALYEYYCALCHGITGKGDGFNSYNMDSPPAKHADKSRMAARSDTQLQTIIRKGAPGLGLSPLMPPWGKTLTDREIADLTSYIRTLSR